jgi:hypothetical protein
MVCKSFLAGALALVLAAAPAAAETSFKQLTPLLVDLPGFEGGKAQGMTISVGDGGMTTASRSYKREPASVDVTVMSGPMSVGPLASLATVLQVETSEGHMISGEIDGFRVMKTYNNGDKSGALVIGLSKHAVMTFGYRSLSEDDAVELARKLDWKAIAAALAE